MKIAYPNFSENPSSPVYNISKWISAMKDIYIKIQFGEPREKSISSVVEGWSNVERNSFINWMRYYESGDYLKYKKAQNASYYVNDDLNYFLPNPKNTVPSPIKSIREQIADIPREAVFEKKKETDQEEKKRIIEDQRRRMLGRLNSVEKLLGSQQGHIFAGDDFEKLLSAIYEIKKQIQTINKVKLSSQTISDLIVRQANILNRQGHQSAANFMVKLAQQAPGDFSVNLGAIPAGGSQPDGLGGLGNNAPDLSQPPGGIAEDGNDKEITNDSAVGQFIENLQDSGITDEKDIDIDNDVIIDKAEEEFNDLVIYAQDIKPKSNPAIKDIAPVAQEGDGVKNDFDSIIDSAFSNLTVLDVVAKLDAVNNIFRNREISRQLAIIDLMLDKLGIAAYFPTLSECANKTLENSQYCLSRIEDILSKLRGTLKTENIDLENSPQGTPESQGIKRKLEDAEIKDKQKKDMKKQVQDQVLIDKATKPTPEIENPQAELAAPVEVESPAPVKPNQVV